MVTKNATKSDPQSNLLQTILRTTKDTQDTKKIKHDTFEFLRALRGSNLNRSQKAMSYYSDFIATDIVAYLDHA